MREDWKKSPNRTSRMRGFSMVELLVVLGIIMVITAVTLPSFMQAYGAYQLTDRANQVATIIKFTRYEAIRTNVAAATPLKAQFLQTTAGTYAFTDSNNDGAVQNTETQTLFSGRPNLVSAGTPPNTAGLTTAVMGPAAGVAPLTNPSITNGSINFDARGAVTPIAVNVLYVGNTALPNLGYRAVVVLPSGSVQIWTTDPSGNWAQLN
jgi:Tfp pilus assembly protein FimT